MVSIIPFSKFNRLKIDKFTIVFKENIGEWCRKPYPGHRYGCPNYGKKLLCPPKSPFLKDKILSYNFHELYYVEFDFKGYKEQMAIEKPENTDRQNACCLYYQPSLKMHLFDTVGYDNGGSDLLLGCGHGFGNYDERKTEEENNKKGRFKIYSMESVGINVFTTLNFNNIFFEDRPENKIVLCSLLCSNLHRFE